MKQCEFPKLFQAKRKTLLLPHKFEKDLFFVSLFGVAYKARTLQIIDRPHFQYWFIKIDYVLCVLLKTCLQLSQATFSINVSY